MKQVREQVDMVLSDLFFNYDHGDSIRLTERGKFIGFDESALLKAATDFCSSYSPIIAIDMPSPEALAADFLARV